MPTGIKPTVNEAREFLEIAKDFKESKEIIREALSNSWDANADMVKINFTLAPTPGSRKKKIYVQIQDNGEGMDETEIKYFFNLGDSHKSQGSIGTKGHGTKIYYKSSGIYVDTWKNDKKIHAESEVPPWESLKKGIVPTYKYDVFEEKNKGTIVRVDGFEAKQKDFSEVEPLYQYIKWYTIAGSFCHYFGIEKTMDIELKPINLPTPILIPFGFQFPEEHLDLSKGTGQFCRLFGPETLNCGYNEQGQNINVEIIGAIIGEGKRDIVPQTYENMGLWLCRDYIRIERNNFMIEKVFKGQYFYRSMLIFANCQQFELTANRNNIRNDQEEFDMACKGIMEFIDKIKNDTETNKYFEYKKQEDENRSQEQRKKELEIKKISYVTDLAKRINEYKGRPDLQTSSIVNAPLKEPRNEAETVLLLQSMISSSHRGIDFRIGEYSVYRSTDLLVEQIDKGIKGFKWVEVVHKLENLYSWPHPPECIHKIVCWELGKVSEEQIFDDGRKSFLRKKSNGRYNLDIGSDTIDVYVLRELL
jgi:hypothetical protein